MKIIKKLVALLVLVSIISAMFTLFASANSGTIAWGAANAIGNGVRIRSGPGTNHDILTQAAAGEAMVILERTNSQWYKVNYNGTIGYVSVPLLDRPRVVADFNAVGTITGSGVNLRDKPNTNSAVLGNYPKGTDVVIVGINEGWYKIKYDGKIGYMRSDFISIFTSGIDDEDGPDSIITGTVSANNVNMRAGATTSSTLLGTYSKDTVVRIIGAEDIWYNVMHDGKTGYIRADLLNVTPEFSIFSDTSSATSGSNTVPQVAPVVSAPNPNAELSQQIVDLAVSFVGTKYVYGGSSPAGFDCSGLTSYVYKAFGITLTRNAGGQYRDNGVHVRREELAPGDLIFTSLNGTTINHVLIYMGNNKVVHASSSNGKVIIGNFDTEYYARTFFGAKRIV
ncbi:MAG: SH3 domain-containing protein [Oscillospiraceae bacterium]|nr:SH3 domain-containing protein [Oscillospiraceae bacterium]